MLHELSVEVEPQCVSIWKKLWEKRFARVTLLVDFDDRFAVVVDPSNGFWFLPGGGVEQNESIEEAAKREAEEELGLKIRINGIIKTFHVKLISTRTREHLIIPPFVVVHATPIEGQLKKELAQNWKIRLIKKKDCESLLHTNIPKEYECRKPHTCISKEVVRQLVNGSLT